MTAPLPALPRRPADLAGDHTLADLVDAYARHVLALAAARAARCPADPGHVLAALAVGQAIAADLHGERWPIVRDSLARGVGHDELAAALDVDPPELAAGLAAWADQWAADGVHGDDERGTVRAPAYPACTGADDLCGAPAGQPCEHWCPSWATGGAPW